MMTATVVGLACAGNRCTIAAPVSNKNRSLTVAASGNAVRSLTSSKGLLLLLPLCCNRFHGGAHFLGIAEIIPLQRF
jgi:hypothetical protein